MKWNVLGIEAGAFPRSKSKVSKQTGDVPDYRREPVSVGDEIPYPMIRKLCMPNALIRICADLRLTTVPA